MENIFPGFRRHKDEDEYDRHGKYSHRPGYGAGYPGPYEYTGQPVGFEHLGSPPKHDNLDARTIAELGYEGPEGERRKVEAINEVIEQEYDSRHPNYRNSQHSGREYSVRPEYSDYPPVSTLHPGGYPEGYGQEKYRHGGGYDKHGKYHSGRESDEEDDGYAGQDDRYRRRYAGDQPRGEDYAVDYREREEYRRRYGVDRPYVNPVKVERKVEEDGTVVERIYPANSGGSSYGQPDPNRIHFGRQESFAADVDGVIPGTYVRQDSYPGGGYAPTYNPATSSYGRRPYEGSSSEYVEERDRRY